MWVPGRTLEWENVCMPGLRLISGLIVLLAALPAAAGELVLPVFAHGVEGQDNGVWSSEIYLTNPGDQPVQVTLVRFLPGEIVKPTPCDLFMPPTRVVPPKSAVVWTAAGLATDLGCAEEARGGLVLRADGPVHVTSRLVNLARDDQPLAGVLSGRGEAFEAIPIDRLPAAGTHLLPALMWHRNPCGNPAFDTFIGFANPGPDAVDVVLDVPHEVMREVLIDGRRVVLPYHLRVAPESWRQIRLAPQKEEEASCGGVESFLVSVEIDSPLALYASVVDRKSGDPRTVRPVRLEPN
jgi:hypothetical protein